jgi:iron complex outermembrane receptor protein
LFIIGASLAGANTFAKGRSISEDTVVTKEVIVSGSRAPMLYKESGRSVKVYDKMNIRAMPARNIEGLLKMNSSIDLRQRGASGAQADLSMRGGTFEQTLILLNGIKMNDPQTGHHNLNLPVDLEMIQKIETIGGGASRALGPSAFSGAVNFITDAQRSNGGGVNISGGSNNYYKLGLYANANLGGFSNFLSFSKNKSDGFAKNTDFDRITFYDQLAYSGGIGAISADFGYVDKNFGANSFYSAAYPNQFEQTKTTNASIKYTVGSEIKFSQTAYYRRNQDRFELFRGNLTKSCNYHLTNTYGAETKLSALWSLGVSSIGFEYRNENLLSSNLGNPRKDAMKAPGEEFGKYTKDYFRNSASVYIEHNFKVGDLSVSGGALYNKNTDFDGKFYPGIDLAYTINDNWNVFSSYNKSLRYPTFTDLFYIGADRQGNVNLKPEESDSYEIGVRFNQSIFSLQGSSYYRAGKNMIDWAKKSPSDAKFQSMNIAEANVVGFELNCDINLRDLSSKNFSMDKFSLSYAHQDLYADKNKETYYSIYVMDYMKNKFSASLGANLPYGFRANAEMILEDRAGKYQRFSDKKMVEFDLYALFNFKAAYTMYNIEFSAEAYNLFDSKYVDLSNVPLPGAEFRFGIAYKIGE